MGFSYRHLTHTYKGQDALNGEYRELSPELATSIYDEWTRREEKAIDPVSFVEEDDAV